MFEEQNRRRALLKEKGELKDSFSSFLRHGGGVEEEKEHFGEEYLLHLGEIEERLSCLEDDCLVRKARSLYISIPPDTDENIWGSQNFGRFKNLTSNGRSHLSNEIRKRKKENIELGIKLILALTGLVGAFIGLVAIWPSG